ncbi:MAG: hypothetical protein U9O53_03060 [archaeon]|nr:hypothetical protein [archaeon]
MKKGMTISITLIMAMLVALVIALVLINMFSGSMEKGNRGLTDSLNSTTGDKTGIACTSHCATCCLSHSESYCEDVDHGAPSDYCECPNC